jgi:tetratricopeptide (TPR) repeat protein
LVLNAGKLYMFWEGPERSNEKYVYFFWDRFGLGRVPMPGFWLVSALALAGMIRLWPRRRELSLLYLFVLAYMLGIVAFFVVARYRLPAAPVLIIFASWAVVDIAGALRARRRGYALRMLTLVLVLFAAVNASYPEFLSRRPAHITISHYTLAGAFTERGDEDGALRELLAARAAYEKSPSTYYAGIAQDINLKLGAIYHQRGQCDEALQALSQIQPSHPNIVEARFLFADCCERTGRFNEAGLAYELMLKSDPNDLRALQGYIRCLEELGHREKAIEARKRLPPGNH